MTLFHVIKFNLSLPATKEEVDALPAEVLRAYRQNPVRCTKEISDYDYWTAQNKRVKELLLDYEDPDEDPATAREFREFEMIVMKDRSRTKRDRK